MLDIHVLYHNCTNIIGAVVGQIDIAIHGIVILKLPQNGVKSNDNTNIELARDEK